MLASDVIEYAQRSVLCWLATVDIHGCPNVSPKEIFTVVDNQNFVIANIASPASIRNIRHNPNVCLSFIDVFVQKGFKVKGIAEIISEKEEAFPVWSSHLQPMTGDRFKIHSVIVVRPFAIEEIIAPSYRFYPSETTEQSQYEAARRAYNAVPKP